MRKLVKNSFIIASVLATLVPNGWAAPATPETLVLPFENTQGITATMDTAAPRELKVVTGAADSTQGGSALRLSGTSRTAEGSKYLGIMVPLGKTVDLRKSRFIVDARTDHPENTKALYIRAYNKGENKPSVSLASWSGELTKEWRTFSIQPNSSVDGLSWETSTVEERVPSSVDRIEFIVGTRDNNVPISFLVDNLRLAPRIPSLRELVEPKTLTREIPIAQDGQAQAIILHPDSPAGRTAAARVVEVIRARTGATLTARAGTEADLEPTQNAIILGNVDNNPALQLLYARYFTPVDAVCPGPGGALVHTVMNPFGKGASAVVLGASDDAGLAKATDEFLKVVAAQPASKSLKFTRIFERHYSQEFLKRFSWANDKEYSTRLAAGLKEGQRTLDEGKHTSIAGNLRDVALRYQITGNSVEAKLFVALWDMYEKSAVADARKFGGAWGFDSDFPSHQVVAGWDNIEEDPSLTDEERVRVVKAMSRWLEETVISSTTGNADHVPHNHQTFPALGALFAGLYFSNGYDNLPEGPRWLKIADDLFQRQATYYKPYEDCNGYQWLTNGHLFRYAVARRDFTVFKNGNGRKIIDYSIGTMDNFGYQVPYGDTGSWQCWNSEMICLDIFAFATKDPAARWTANRKRQLKNTSELYSYYQLADAPAPQNFNGVQTWPLDMNYVHTFPEEKRPADAQLFDKISFRDRLDPATPYLLLDGLNNGGHKHLDGNTLERLTAFDRIWLADNDYFKTQVKYHNSVMIFKDGEAQAIPSYVANLGAGETPRYGYSQTRLNDYTGVNWDRYVVWVKRLQAFVVLDKLTALQPDDYQFRVLWHGVGEAQLDGTGMLLTQKGPSLRIQTAAGPQLNLVNDTELGTNWAGYPHAAPVVRSMSATAKVKLAANQSYMFATVMHGSPNGVVKPWKIDHIADGIRIDTGTEKLAVVLDSAATPQLVAAAPTGRPQVGIIDNSGFSLLGVASEEARKNNAFAQFQNIDRANPQAATTLNNLKVVAAPKNLTLDDKAPAHPALWQISPAPERVILTGNLNTGGALLKQAKITSDVAPGPNAFDNSVGPIEALLDGGFDTMGNSLMFPIDKTVQVTVDLGNAADIENVRWMQWWATTSSKGTSYLPERVTVALSNDNFKADNRALGEVVDTATHANFGSPIAYNVPGKSQRARYVRLTFVPKKGSALYLGEIFVEGKPGGTGGTSAYHFTRVVPARLGNATPTILATTAEGTLLALDKAGKTVWSKNFGTQLNDVAAADLDGDGRDEILLARQDHFVTVLDSTGQEKWSSKLQFYRRPPFVNLVRAGDIDGDGKLEVIAGGENWRFYAFDANGKELWNYEAVHPSRSGAVADLDGDGKDEVIAGTHYYQASVLGSNGTAKWKYSFGPISYDITTGSFDGDKTRGVIFGGGDGILHYLNAKGEARLKFNTGDEVRRVATADTNGDGRDEIFGGSMNGNLYCFDAAGKRLWRRDLDSPIRALVPVKAGASTVIVAGTEAGEVFTFDGAGKLLATSKLGAAVATAGAAEGEIVIATADGILRRLKVVQ